MYRKLGEPEGQYEHCGEENISYLCWESNPNSSVVQPVY
jgi:hypothetical protein